MHPFRVTKVIEVIRDLGADQFGCQIRVIESQVAFEGPEERFRYGIVPTVTPRWLILQTVPLAISLACCSSLA